MIWLWMAIAAAGGWYLGLVQGYRFGYRQADELGLRAVEGASRRWYKVGFGHGWNGRGDADTMNAESNDWTIIGVDSP